MSKAWEWFILQLKHMLPAFFFFFVIFSLADITELLRSRLEAGTYYRFAVIVGSALVMAKVVVLSDFLSITHIFSKKPLIYNTLWKSFVYLLCSTFVRFLEHALPLYMETQNFGQVEAHVFEMVGKQQFWIAEVWLTVLLIIFVAYRELVCAVGEERVRKLFFG
jgi:hypothetical protein